VPGLDSLIEGGYARGTVNLVSGPPGSGKSLVGLHFLYHGASEKNETGLYITLEESRENINRSMHNFGMDMKKFEENNTFVLIDIAQLRSVYTPDVMEKGGMFGFRLLENFLDNIFKNTKVDRLVVDSVTALGLFYPDLDALRQDMFAITNFLKNTRVTCVLIAESKDEVGFVTRYETEPFLADSHITMSLEKVKGELRRTMTIRKMRFTDHDSHEHPVLISSKGLEVSAETTVY
jgi:circadian clock protein KaiC